MSNGRVDTCEVCVCVCVCVCECVSEGGETYCTCESQRMQ